MGKDKEESGEAAAFVLANGQSLMANGCSARRFRAMKTKTQKNSGWKPKSNLNLKSTIPVFDPANAEVAKKFR